MAVKTFTSEILTSSDTNTYLTNAMAQYVKSQTIGSGVSSVTVTNAFSSTYDSYQIVIEGTTNGTAGAAMLFRCVDSGGTDNASNWRGNTFYVVSGGAGGLTNDNFTSNASGQCGGFSTSAGSMAFLVQSPFASTRTQLAFTMADNNYWRTSAAVLDNATSYTGFKLVSNAGTFTGGTITVYGFRKA